MPENAFWKSLQILVTSNKFIVDRPKGTVHPRYPEYIYPLDYGYIENSKSGDGDEIDAWKGSLAVNKITGLVVAFDALKKDSEIKILIGCSSQDKKVILNSHRRGDMVAILVDKP